MNSVEPQSGDVRAALGRILATNSFAGSAGLSALLRYLVEQTLEGNADRLKEYTLGVEVFHRGESFDPREDTIVRVQARRLRAKLKDYYRSHGRADPVVITIPKGRYVAEFRESGAWIESLAVLPLKSLSGDPTEERLADGLTAALISDLARANGLRVTGEASSMKFKSSGETRQEIARKLDADVVIEGSVYRTNGSLRVSTHLVEPADGRQLWSGDVTGKVEELHALQRELARSIHSQVQEVSHHSIPPHVQEPYSPDPKAVDLYLRGRQSPYIRTPKLLEVAALLEDAVAIDPKYAIAHAGLAEAYLNLSSYLMEPREAMEKARAHANRALELDDSLSEAHAALGMTRLFYDWDRNAARKSVARAISWNPNSSRAHLLYALSLASEARMEEAFSQLARARELDPLSIEIRMYGALFKLVARDYHGAADEARRILKGEPSFAFGRSILGFALTLAGDHATGIDELRAAADQEEIPWTVLWLHHGYALAGDSNRAARLVQKIIGFADRQYLCCYEVGEANAVMRETDEAFHWLNKAVHQRSDCMIWLEVEPWMDPLRNDSRYKELVDRAGISVGNGARP